MAGRTPPSPWTGSTMIAHVVSSMAASNDARSLNVAYVKPGVMSPKPCWQALSGWPVALIAPTVRPWNDILAETMP